jgi:hypothetical protein
MVYLDMLLHSAGGMIETVIMFTFPANRRCIWRWGSSMAKHRQYVQEHFDDLPGSPKLGVVRVVL